MSSGLERRGGPTQPGVKNKVARHKVFFILAPPCVIVGRHPCVFSGGRGIASSYASCGSETRGCFYFFFIEVSLQMIVMLFFGGVKYIL